MTVYLASASPQRLALLQQLGCRPQLYPVYTDESLPDYGQFAAQNPQAKADHELCHIVSQVARQKLLEALRQQRPHWLSSASLTENRELTSATKPHAAELWLAADTLVAVRRNRLPQGWTAEKSEKEFKGQFDGQFWGQWLLLGKPRNESQAQNYLRLLSNTTQSVCSAIAFAAHSGTASLVTRLAKHLECPLAGSTDCALYSEISQLGFRQLAERDIQSYLATGEWREAAGAYRIQGQGAGLVAWQKGSLSNIIGLPQDFVQRLLAAFAQI